MEITRVKRIRTHQKSCTCDHKKPTGGIKDTRKREKTIEVRKRKSRRIRRGGKKTIEGEGEQTKEVRRRKRRLKTR